MAEREQLEIAPRASRREWLADHQTSSAGVWVITYKKHSGGPLPTRGRGSRVGGDF